MIHSRKNIKKTQHYFKPFNFKVEFQIAKLLAKRQTYPRTWTEILNQAIALI